MNLVEKRCLELQGLLTDFVGNASQSISEVSYVIADALKRGNKILICGNGGSAADSQHLVAEFVNSFSKDLKRPGLAAISLASDVAVITAIANDTNYEQIFARQVEALGNANDILIVLSTSGSSSNCVRALQCARDLGLITIAFTKIGAFASSIADFSIEVPSENTQHIQACHVFAYHTVVELVEQILYRSEAANSK